MRWARRSGDGRPVCIVVGVLLLNGYGIGDAVVQAVLIVIEHLEFAFYHHWLQRIFHRRLRAHLNHALRATGQAKAARQRYRSEQKMTLALAGLERHHEALHLLHFLMQSHLLHTKHWQDFIFLILRGDRRKQAPRNHVGTLRQRCER